MTRITRRFFSHSIDSTHFIASNHSVVSRLYSFPIECLHNYLNCPWWIGIGLMAASAQLICTYPLVRKLPKITKTEIEKITEEKVIKQSQYKRIIKTNDRVLRKNFHHAFLVSRAKWIRSVSLFYLPQVLFVLVYLGGFWVVYKITQTPSMSMLQESSWLLPALTSNYTPNFALDVVNGVSFGVFGLLLNKKYRFLPTSLLAMVAFSSSVGLFGAVSNAILPGSLKVYCASSLISHLLIIKCCSLY